MLRALLEPRELISKYELAGCTFQVLAIMEEMKVMPWNAVWDVFCLRNGVPVGDGFIPEIEKYEAEVLSRR